MLSTRAAVVLQEQVAFGQAGNRENSKRTSILLAFMFPDFEGQDAEPIQFFFEEDLYFDVVCILMDLQYRGSLTVSNDHMGSANNICYSMVGWLV